MDNPLNLRPGEAPHVLPALGFSLLSVGALTLATIASDTLFVSAFSLTDLSTFYAAATAARIAVSFAYAALARDSKGARLDIALLAVAAVTMILGGVLARSSSRPVLYAVCLAQVIVPPILPLASFNAAMGRFHARQTKRLLPLVAAAATLGTIVTGALASLGSLHIGPSGLLVAGGVLAILAVPFASSLAKRSADDPVSTIHPSARSSSTLGAALRDVQKVPVVRLLVVHAALFAALTIWVDFAFKSALKARYSQNEMAGFLGTFSVLSNGVVLAAQLFFTSRFVSRFGIATALRVPPAALLFVSPLLALSPGVAAATAGKLTETVLRFSLGTTMADLLLTPTSTAVRTRAKITVKTAASPLGSLAAALTLAAFGARGPSSWAVTIAIMITSVILLVALSGARDAYTAALAKTLGQSDDADSDSAVDSGLGVEAKDVAARALATPQATSPAAHPALINDAIEVNLRFAEQLLLAASDGPSGPTSDELKAAFRETTSRILDLAGRIGDRTLIERARVGLEGGGRSRSHALELLEQVLPPSLASRTVDILEQSTRFDGHRSVSHDETNGPAR